VAVTGFCPVVLPPCYNANGVGTLSEAGQKRGWRIAGWLLLTFGLSHGGTMTLIFFTVPFKALWTAIFAFLNSALAYSALEAGWRIHFLISGLTSAFLIYLTYTYFPNLPQF
jgi:hypothetical protein